MRLALNTIALEPNRWNADKSLARPFEDVLARVAEAGYDGCEIWQYHVSGRPAEDDPRLAAEARSRNVDVLAVGAYPLLHLGGEERKAQRDAMARLFDVCKFLGTGILKMFVGRVASAKITPEERARSMDFLRELLALAEGADVLVTAETHANTLADSVDACLGLMEEVASDRLKLCFQPYDMLDTDRALQDYDRLKEHVAHIHLQARDANGFCLMRESPLDFGAFLAAARGSGFDGLLSVEFVKGCVPAEGESYSDEAVVAAAAQDRAFVLQKWAEA